MLVLDCSVLMAWVLPDESSHYGEKVREAIVRHTLPIMVPPLFFLEVMNVLNVMQRRKRMDQAQVERALQLLQRLPVTVDVEVALLPAIMRLREMMCKHGLTAYDAAYLELAQRRNLPLSTLDQALRCAAEEEKMFFAE